MSRISSSRVLKENIGAIAIELLAGEIDRLVATSVEGVRDPASQVLTG